MVEFSNIRLKSMLVHIKKLVSHTCTAWKDVQTRENADQKNSVLEHFSRRGALELSAGRELHDFHEPMAKREEFKRDSTGVFRYCFENYGFIYKHWI